MLPRSIVTLPERLRTRATELTGYLAPAEVPWHEAARLVEEVIEASLNETIDLDSAAAETGYTTPHLRRLLGLEPGYPSKIPNAGTADAPLIQRRHLPRKPGHGVRENRQDILPVAHRHVRAPSSRMQVARAVAAGGDSDG